MYTRDRGQSKCLWKRFINLYLFLNTKYIKYNIKVIEVFSIIFVLPQWLIPASVAIYIYIEMFEYMLEFLKFFFLNIKLTILPIITSVICSKFLNIYGYCTLTQHIQTQMLSILCSHVSYSSNDNDWEINGNLANAILRGVGIDFHKEVAASAEKYPWDGGIHLKNKGVHRM